MRYIFSHEDTIDKSNYDNPEKILTGFVFLDLSYYDDFNDIDGKYQLCHVSFDTDYKDGILLTCPCIERCIDGKYADVPRSVFIGEPTFEAMLKWVELYGFKSQYRKERYERLKQLVIPNVFTIEDIIRQKVERKKSDMRGLKDYDTAFVWYDVE